ncbi:hypothetical protein Leryth_003353, partial [Lithospermum erythrorhizon]
ADLLLWRNKQGSACLLASGTVIWLLFEWIDYHLLTFICHSLILALATCFLWSNLSFFINKSPVEFPNVVLSEDLCNSIALLLRDRCNQAVCIFRDIATGKDLKKFLYAIGSLWIASVVGRWFDFLTLCYIAFVMMLTVPLLYEKNEDRVDAYAQDAKSKLQRHYSKLDETVLKKLPHIPFTRDTSKQH